MKLKPGHERFLVGMGSAFVVPVVKLYQNGIKVEEFNAMVFLGIAIPIVLMSVFVGGYAVLIEKSETDYKKLFRMCVSLPALMVTFIGGVNVKDGIVSTAHAAAPEAKLIKCMKSSGIKQGLDAAYEVLTNNEMSQYLVVSKEQETKSYFLVDEVKWYIQRDTDEKEKGVILYDRYKCEVVK